MRNKLLVIINSLGVPKIKKILLYEMKFLVPNYSCLQNPWLGGYAPRSPFSLSSSSTEFVEPPPQKKFLGMPLVVSSTPRLHFTPRKDPVPIVQEAGWAPGPVWTGGKSRPHRDSIPDHPARSQSLYWLSYLAHTLHIYIQSGPKNVYTLYSSISLE